MSTITQRIEQLIKTETVKSRITDKEKKLSFRRFDEIIGQSDGYFGRQFRSGGAIGSDVLESISQSYPDWNLVWIITAQGDMRNSTSLAATK